MRSFFSLQPGPTQRCCSIQSGATPESIKKTNCEGQWRCWQPQQRDVISHSLPTVTVVLHLLPFV